ncbi:nuclear autoantigenic sperm protein-like [Scylla paramamosain]|uniref:nuclear autoantigenic sperm protein-like n=1 Tax=Scylla paramamosain TaxID=85552 RepID=UPI0030838CF7
MRVSEECDRRHAASAAFNRFSQGKRHLLVGDFKSAVTAFKEATESLVELYGEQAAECGDAYHHYGRALLELARKEAGVLGPDLDGASSQEGSTGKEEDEEEESEESQEEEEGGKKEEGEEEEEEEEDGEGKEKDKKEGNAAEGEGQLVVHRDSEKLGTLDHLEGVRAHCEPGRGHWYRGGTEMHHHSFAVVDGHPALLCPRLQSLQNCLQWRVVRVLVGNWDAHGAVVHILPAMGGVGENTEEEEEVTTLQCAWEWLDVARVIFDKQEETPEVVKKRAQIRLSLGEVCMESEDYEGAINEFKQCLQMQESALEKDDRSLAERHYQLGLVYTGRQ